MKLWTYWGILFFMLMISLISSFLWPSVEQLERDGLEATFTTALLFRPFHIILSFFALIVSLLLGMLVYKKIVYEWRIAYLFRKMPYEPALLFVVLLGILYYLYSVFQLLFLILFSVFVVYETVHVFRKRNQAEIYVRDESR